MWFPATPSSKLLELLLHPWSNIPSTGLFSTKRGKIQSLVTHVSGCARWNACHRHASSYLYLSLLTSALSALNLWHMMPWQLKRLLISSSLSSSAAYIYGFRWCWWLPYKGLQIYHRGHTSFVIHYNVSEKIKISVCFSCHPDVVMDEHGWYDTLAYPYWESCGNCHQKLSLLCSCLSHLTHSTQPSAPVSRCPCSVVVHQIMIWCLGWYLKHLQCFCLLFSK
jgi:hypothetical protein